MGLAKGAPQSLISLGAALTLHRVSRLEKKGHKNPPPLTPTPEPSVALACTSSALIKTGLKLNRDHSSSERAST